MVTWKSHRTLSKIIKRVLHKSCLFQLSKYDVFACMFQLLLMQTFFLSQESLRRKSWLRHYFLIVWKLRGQRPNQCDNKIYFMAMQHIQINMKYTHCWFQFESLATKPSDICGEPHSIKFQSSLSSKIWANVWLHCFNGYCKWVEESRSAVNAFSFKQDFWEGCHFSPSFLLREEKQAEWKSALFDTVVCLPVCLGNVSKNGHDIYNCNLEISKNQCFNTATELTHHN